MLTFQYQPKAGRKQRTIAFGIRQAESRRIREPPQTRWAQAHLISFDYRFLTGWIRIFEFTQETDASYLFGRQRQNPGDDSLEALEQARITSAARK